MRKLALLSLILSLGLVAGCGKETASPTPSPPSPPTPVPETATATPPSGPALCTEAVTEVDHVRGPADASITLIVYSDFQ